MRVATYTLLALACASAAFAGLAPRDTFEVPTRVQELLPRGSILPPKPVVPPSFPKGTKADGAKCAASAECRSGSCLGFVCTAPSAPGAGCKRNQNCASGVCVNAKCVPQPGTGVAGDFCNGSNQCSQGGYCRRGKCDRTKENGFQCYKPEGCDSGHCVNGKCQAAGKTPIGGSCKADSSCTAGAYCFRSTDCRAIKQAGQPCYKNAGCASGLCAFKKCVLRG